MVEKLHRYCTAEYTARNRSGDPVDLVDCCEEAGVLLLWTSLLNCTRSVRSQTGTKQEKGLLLLRVLLSFFSNQAYKYLPPTHALLRLRSTKEDVGQLVNKAGQGHQLCGVVVVRSALNGHTTDRRRERVDRPAMDR